MFAASTRLAAPMMPSTELWASQQQQSASAMIVPSLRATVLSLNSRCAEAAGWARRAETEAKRRRTAGETYGDSRLAAADFVLDRGLAGVRAASLESLTLGASLTALPNVHAQYHNCSLLFFAGAAGTELSLTIPEGVYEDAAQLVASLVTALDQHASLSTTYGLSISLSSSSSSSTGRVTLTQAAETDPLYLALNPRFSGLAEMLGFSAAAEPDGLQALATAAAAGGAAPARADQLVGMPLVQGGSVTAPCAPRMRLFSDMLVHVEDNCPAAARGGGAERFEASFTLARAAAARYDCLDGARAPQSLDSVEAVMAECALDRMAVVAGGNVLALDLSSGSSTGAVGVRRTYAANGDGASYGPEQELTRLRVTLTNEWGDVLVLPANAHFRVTLRVTSLR